MARMQFEDTQPLPPPLVLVVGIALDASDDVVWDETKRLASHAEPAVLHVCHVVEPRSPAIPTIRGEDGKAIHEVRESELRDFLESRLTETDSYVRGSVWVHVTDGRPAERISQLAVSRRADAIIVGSVGSTGLRDMSADSTALNLFRSSPCSVVLARPKDSPPMARPFRTGSSAAVSTPGQWVQ